MPGHAIPSRAVHLEQTIEPAGRSVWRSLAASDTGKAAGLAGATIASNVIALVFTVVFARVLGASGYGSLAALVSAFIIPMVPGRHPDRRRPARLADAVAASPDRRGRSPALAASARA